MVPAMYQPELITTEQFQAALPKQLKGAISQDVIDGINAVIGNPELAENYRDNLLSYTQVLQEGRYKIGDYVNAVRYVSHRLMGDTVVMAYAKSFPDRYQRLVNQGVSDKDISSHAHAYNKNMLVAKIFEQTLIPVHVLNADLQQKAINVLAELMVSSTSDKVRSDSADKLLTHLKAPETKRVELSVTTQQSSTIDELAASTRALVEQQKQMLQANLMNAKQMAHSKLIEGVAEEVLDDDS